MKTGHLDGQGTGELRNFNFQNLSSAPTTNVYAGRFYFNTTDHTLYVYNGTTWVDALSQGDYTFQNGVEVVSGTRNVQLNLATGANAGNVTLSADSNGLAASAPAASTSTAGLIEIATDSEVTTGTAEDLAVNPKQLATKVDANAAITAGAGTVISYDAKGLVTGSSEIGIDSSSSDYLTFNTSTHEIGANVDTTVTTSSTNLVTSGAVASAIASAITGAMVYQGVWTATSQTDYSSITLPVKSGYYWLVSGSATIDGVEWNSGDLLVIKNDVAAGSTLTNNDINKIDNTESADIVRLSATQTLTNKTVDADDNTISNLEVDNFKSGVVRTSTDGIRAVSSASDTDLVTEKAVASALASRVYTEQNSALTVSGGLCTWTVTHNLNNSNVSINVYEVSTGDKVMYDCSITSVNVVTVKILSVSNIAADTYKVVVLG